VSRVAKIIAGIGVAAVAAPLMVWGFVILLVTMDASRNETTEDRRALEQRYAKAFAGAEEVNLLETSEQSLSFDAAGSATIDVNTGDVSGDAAERSLRGRDLDIHSIQKATEECRQLVRAVAGRCVVADARAQSPTSLIMKLEFVTSGQEDAAKQSGKVDALRVRYVDRRRGDDAAGREDIYARIAGHCRGTKMTAGHCSISKIIISTKFAADDKGQKWSTTQGSADMLVTRNEAPEQ